MNDQPFLDGTRSAALRQPFVFDAEAQLGTGYRSAANDGDLAANGKLRLFVAIATTGRAAVLAKVVERLGQQTRPADGTIIIGVEPADVAGVATTGEGAEIGFAQRGLCRQRNAVLDALRGRADAVVFFDDDFVPADDYLANLELLLLERPDVAGLTGRLLADGAHTNEIAFEQAVELLDRHQRQIAAAPSLRASLYGCNMAVRLDSVGTLRFDEQLPLYGWLEDVDFTYQLARKGALIEAGELTGIHLGTRGGRTSGRRLGYSQVANAIYLLRKGTIDPWQGEGVMIRNLLSNLVRSFWSEPEIDRRGRLIGNLLAVADWMRGRVDPGRIESL